MDEYDVPQNAGRVGAGRAGLASASYRPQRSAGMDAGTRRLALIAGGLGGCLLLVVGFWSLTGHGSGAVPLIQADKTPLRVKPENAGGMQVAGGSEDLMTADAPGKAGTVAPPPETPDPQALRAQVVPAPAPAAAPAPSAAPTVAPVPPPARAAAAAPAPRVAARATPIATGSVLGAARHGAEVQLGALSTEAGARVEWERLAHRLPGLFDQHRPDVARAEVNGRTFWRLRTSGFSDVAEATTFCEQVRGKGGDCSIVAF
jgi:hypothetical protein